ncbi:NAD(P)/FAD-dependent oxidoreductase [Pseudonocardia parietis]|uniref:Thioredoxin reductase n=1 Tax=Pseudonocardia parietis TaxID=570936 RepID=A0ABS4VSP9_9PSEU|nr:FAD-dependent oxidoreductase [Pseudonocardia parietis]MBP2366950.1 thioredoxin reductase [Pseudonocardia parietis]
MSAGTDVDVAVIGAGPAGLAAAKELASRTSARVAVLEREPDAGGIPRHSDHLGYGLRDRRTFTSGPRYARRLVNDAVAAGAEVLTRTMVTDWDDDGADGIGMNVTGPAGRRRVRARAVILATGARERPRPARMIPGDRPAGVLTTGELQNKVHLHHQEIGTRAVVVGAELVSWSAVMTLREAGCRTEALVTHHPRPESYGIVNVVGRVAFRTRVAVGSRVTRVLGRGRVSGVEIEDLGTGRRRVVACDTVVFTGDWVPDHELARSAGITLDRGTRGPLVDAAGRTDRPGIFAAGNLVHPVDTADVAALAGVHVAGSVARHLAGSLGPEGPTVPLVADEPIRWVSPGLHRPGLPAPARARIEAWVHELVRVPRITVTQDGRVLTRRRLPWPAAPGRVFRIPWDVLDGVDPAAGPVHLSL